MTRNQFLRAYDVTGDADRGTNLGAIINALELRRAHPHLSSNEDLADYLNDYPTAADELGFDSNDISEDVFAYARRERLEPWVESMIEQQAEWAAERVADQRYNDGYDEYYEKLFPDEGPSIAQVLAATDQVLDTLTDNIEDERDSDLVVNDFRTVLELIGALGKSNDFASHVLRLGRKDTGDAEEWDVSSEELEKFNGEQPPTPTGFFDIIRQHDPMDYHEMFEAIFRELYKRAERFGLFDRPVEILIDETVIPFYPTKAIETEDDKLEPDLPDGATGGAKKAYTHYGFTFLTISIADPDTGRTFTLASFPKWRNGLTHVGLTYLINRAREFVTIDRVYMDAGFRAIENLNWLDDEGINFVARVQKRGWRKDWVNALTGEATAAAVEKEIDPNNKPASGEYSFVAVRRKEGSRESNGEDSDGSNENYSLSDFTDDHDEFKQTELSDFDEYLHDATGVWDTYVTNIDDVASEEPRQIGQWYNRRGAIEPEYDQAKNNLVAKGGGRNYEIRMLYWLVGITVLNGLKLADLELKDRLGKSLGAAKDGYEYSTKQMGDILFQNPYPDIDYG